MRSSEAQLSRPELSLGANSQPGATAQAATVEVWNLRPCRPLAHESAVGLACFAEGAAEAFEHEGGVLRGKLPFSQQDGVSRPGVALQRVDRDRETGSDRIQMDVANELEEIRLLFNEDALEAVLKEIARPTVDAVEDADIRAEPTLNEAGRGELSGTEPKVRMVGHERPGIESGMRFGDERGETADEEAPVSN
jgi:hypothetical protein